jgi:hypothetical protein
VDIAAFPGSSGSPVLIVDEGGYPIPDGFVTGGSRIFLLGILYAGPQFAADGSLEIKEIPTTWTARFSVALPVHLGFYIKSQELLELGKLLFDADAASDTA